MRLPARLARGSRVAVVAPSAGTAAVFPHVPRLFRGTFFFFNSFWLLGSYYITIEPTKCIPFF